jgi:tRNA G18 (ribose-2'-O)-methylase SpoU
MKEVYVVLDNVRSALNVGAIFRTCEGLGVKQLLLTGISPYPPHNKLNKTALGTTDWVNWKYFKTNESCINYLESNNIPIIIVEVMNDSVPYFELNFPDKVALVFGHEITGVSSIFLKKSQEHVYIPMQGKKESLNVATTVGIIISHVTFCT